MRTAGFFIIVALAGVIGCGALDSTAPRAGRAASLDIVSGNQQQAPAGSALPQPVVVEVTDDQGRPVTGQVVNFRVAAGGGTVFAGTNITDADGRAKDIWTLGTVAGSIQTLEARAVDNATGAPIVFGTFTARVTAGPAAQLEKLTGDEQTLVVGESLPVMPAVRVSDQYGNRRSGDTVSFAITAGGGTLTGAQAVTDSEGVATLGGWAFDDSKTHTVTATVGALNPVVFTARRRGLALDSVAHSGSVLCGWRGTQRYCAGLSNYGAFGTGDPVNDTAWFAAVASPGGLSFKSIDGGSNSFCGLGDDGFAYCWGSDNQLGELGDGTTDIPRYAPTRVALPGGVTPKMASAGGNNACALSTDGLAYCWGAANAGAIGDGLPDSLRQVGRGDNLIQPTPAAVALPTGVRLTTIATDGGSCGLDAAGISYCWGRVIGDGTSSLGPAATHMPPGVSFTAVALTFWATCGLSQSGDVYCWGRNNNGVVGVEGPNDAIVPTPVQVGRPAGAKYVSVKAGSNFVCALTDTGVVYCWGVNQFGQIGIGAAAPYGMAPQYVMTPTPIQMPAGATFVAISAGEYSACARTSAGATYCWGYNANGQLGDGTTLTTGLPKLVEIP